MLVDVVMPDLGLGPAPTSLSLWLVDVGAKVLAGDRLAEVASEGVTVDLPSPAEGVLRRVFVAEDDPVAPGMRLAVIETTQT